MLKSGFDVLKKLFKKVVDFMEAGLNKIVIAIGQCFLIWGFYTFKRICNSKTVIC